MIYNLIEKLIVKIIYVVSTTQTLPDLLISDITLVNGATLKVYVIGSKHTKFKFVYEDQFVEDVKTIRRAYTHRLRPMQELRTGIHDKKLTEFTGVNIKFNKWDRT